MTDAPLNPKGVTIAGIEAVPADVRPAEQRGGTTSVDVRIKYVQDTGVAAESVRYRELKQYQQYAGEADFGTLLGGRPFVREHPLDEWPVESHVVPVVYGEEIYEDQDFWGLIVDVDDSQTRIIGEADTADTYGDEYSAAYGGLTLASPNYYRVSVDLVFLADLEQYADREALLADVSPELTQL